MSRRLTVCALMIWMAAFFSAPSLAADDAATRKDLTAVIALNGQSCQVVSAVRQSESDYFASCEDGKRYRVFTNAKGRVVVEKQ